MNEEEIQEALKVIKEPITVNSIEYKYFDQENYKKILRVYEKCQWFIGNAEQFMQNFKNQQQELDQNKNNWEELEKYINEEWTVSMFSSDNYLDGYSNGINEMKKDILNKMKELEEDK